MRYPLHRLLTAVPVLTQSAMRNYSVSLLLSVSLLGGASSIMLPTSSRRVPTSRQAVLPTPLARRVGAAAYQEVVRPIRRSPAGWFFTDVNCRPFDDLSVEGRLFLATNVAFAACGCAMTTAGGSPAMGLMCELCGVFSTFYHWAQLRVGGTSHPFVQLALLFDYVCALPTVVGGLIYAASAAIAGVHVPLAAIACGISAVVAFVVACLPVCHEPRRYMLVHGLWHVFGAAAGSILAMGVR